MKQFFIKLYRKLIPPPKPVYPCEECFLVLGGAGCNDPCDKIEMDKEILKTHMLEHKTCPDCGSTQFYEGPSGGLATNIKCVQCHHEFNNALPLAVERI